jgi:PncC family amidohydrolase
VDDLEMAAQSAAGALQRAGLTVATAESCTGGLIAKLLTDSPGSSAYFLAGLVTYSNDAKIRLLGVADQTLSVHGAVSRETARAMAEGCRRCCGSDIALVATGIAGPSGGSAEKPIGLVFVGLAHPGGVEDHELRLAPELGRQGIREAAARWALQKLAERCGSLTAGGVNRSGSPGPAAARDPS